MDYPLYKYFVNRKYLENFIEHGEVYLNSLSYFQSCEDSARRDETENISVYKPNEGLIVNNLITGKTFKIQMQLNSQIYGADRIFVFCVSSEHSIRLQNKFCSYGCVEITNVNKFKDRLWLKLKENFRESRLNEEAFLNGPISYYDFVDEPGPRHACPDQIVMAKPNTFSDEKEYRFAFAEDAALFNVNQIQYTLSNSTPQSREKYSHLSLRLGSLSDICRVITL